MTGIQTATEVEVKPLAADDVPHLWRIMQEFPDYNFDDSGPRSLTEFVEQLVDRLQHETVLGFHVAGELVGAMGYRSASPRLKLLRGVCFARAVHGTGIPFEAVGGAIADLFAAGAEKLSAQMFADNAHAWRFFQKLGAVEEGLLRAQTVRAGEPIDVRVFAFFRGEN